MKKQLLTLFIGMLIGAVITAGIFLVFKKDVKGNGMRDDMGEMREPPEWDENSTTDGTRPSKPGRGNTTIEKDTTEDLSNETNT